MGTLTNNVKITIDGFSEENDYNFLHIRLVQELLRPNELTFTLQRKSLGDSANDVNFPLPKKLMGAKVSLLIETRRFDDSDAEQNETLEFEGIIFNVEVYRESNMFSEQLIDVTAYSPDYLLMDHPHCMSYENKGLKAIVKETLSKYSFKKTIDPENDFDIPYTVQYNETNYQFLSRLAQRFGEWMYYNGKSFVFGKIEENECIHLGPRNDIIEYRYQTNLIHHKVTHAHHDYLKYENIKFSDSDIPKLLQPGFHPLTDKAKSMANKLFTKDTFQHLECSISEDNNYNELKISMTGQLVGEMTAQTVCTGTTIRCDLTLGSIIDIKDKFYLSGEKPSVEEEHDDLMICRIVHVTEADGKYRNHFTAITANTTFPPYFNSDSPPRSSAQRAKVMENDDPKKLGRVRVQFLWQEMQDENLMTPWIRIAQPHGGGDKGFYFIPEIGEEVMVDFENGNAEKPYVVATLYHGKKQLPDAAWCTSSNDIKAIRTRNGHTIEIHDKGDNGYIRIYDYKKENYILTFSTDDKLIKLESTGNIELYAKSDIIMEAGGNMKIKVGNNKDIDVKNNMSTKVGGDKKVKADQNIKEEAGINFEMKAGSAMKLSSVTHDQKSSASMKIDGGGMLTAKAGLVKIN